MFDARWRVHDLDGAPPAAPDEDAALVAVVVESDVPTPRRIRVAPKVAGSLHPPRRRGMPETGWTDGRFEGILPAGGWLTVGFAAGAPRNPPVDVSDRGRADDAGEDDPSATDLLRTLGSPAPPRDAVPDAVGTMAPDEPGDGDPHERREATPPDHRPPAAVTDWLDAVDARIGEDRRGPALAAEEAALRSVAARASALAAACRRARPSGGEP